MKITKKKLERIIEEELKAVLEQTQTIGKRPPATNLDGSPSQYSGTSGKTVKTSDNLSTDTQTRALERDLANRARTADGADLSTLSQEELMSRVSDVAGYLARMEYDDVGLETEYRKDLKDIKVLVEALLATYPKDSEG
jgi:hypothetical protein